ncbi:tRNA wybutosine-synthesizing protein 2/3/4-like isoform X3 [Camellia sinensis]|uniref:tRNA wybutosine-synthesizing protein 2/3/4-like isoform X3 n=1 Tax=Camellia sinensis TaxID=4442 RepID=UPI0010368C0E|nr:tRNA wybutosine-synthesizing protein 2/3/4-like isoform X3 [Camellia sinensis]
MEFEKRKAATLASMTSPESDKSPKGTIDTPIIPLLNTINSHPCFFTTSSCSGRISVLSQPPIAAATNKKAKGGTWVFITHSKADPESLLNLLSSAKNPDPTHPPSNLVFRFEPLIIAVECKHVLSAQTLVSLAVSSGFRESGITSVNKRVIIAIRCSIRLEVPLGDTENVLVNSVYLRYLVGIANEKMEVNWRRTDGFLNLLLRNGFGGTEVGENGEQEPLLVKEDDKDGSIKIPDMNLLNNAHDRDMDSDARVPNDTHFGSSGVLDICLPMVPMVIVGEPVEKLFLWGHSACTLDDINHKKVLIFGGFGGMGRHARRNESLLLDPLCGKLETISVQRAPAPRMGHTSSMVGDLMFLIGGRADPVNILNDIWVLNTETSEWKWLECTGTVFPPRHRHAAAVIDSKIYVFGGLNGEIISSALHILDTSSSEWNEIQVQGEWPCPRHSHWVLQLEKKYAKLGKDMLKKFGWLDLGRKVYSKENGIHICFPVTQKFCTTYRDKQNHPGGALEVLDDINPFKAFSGEGVLSKDFTCLTSLNLLMASGATILADEVVKVKKISSAPLKVMSEAVANLLKHKGLPTELLDQLPTRWERLGDIIVLPMTSFKDPAWDSVGAELWPIVAKSLGARRLARQGRVAPTGTRDSSLEVLVGDNGWVDHRENGILYSFDSTKCMFSWGNLSEKLRMARLDCRDEVIVDLFAGIGYFVLPFLVRANAKLVYACEWNPHAVEALRRNLHANSVLDSCIVLEGDNRVTAPKGVADRVSLGLLPTSEGSWVTAVRALRLFVGDFNRARGESKMVRPTHSPSCRGCEMQTNTEMTVGIVCSTIATKYATT